MKKTFIILVCALMLASYYGKSQTYAIAMTSDLKILKTKGWVSTGDIMQKLTLKMKTMNMEVPMNMETYTHFEGK